MTREKKIYLEKFKNKAAKIASLYIQHLICYPDESDEEEINKLSESEEVDSKELIKCFIEQGISLQL